jgi:hypothetical protein
VFLKDPKSQSLGGPGSYVLHVCGGWCIAAGVPYSSLRILFRQFKVIRTFEISYSQLPTSQTSLSWKAAVNRCPCIVDRTKASKEVARSTRPHLHLHPRIRLVESNFQTPPAPQRLTDNIPLEHPGALIDSSKHHTMSKLDAHCPIQARHPRSFCQWRVYQYIKGGRLVIHGSYAKKKNPVPLQPVFVKAYAGSTTSKHRWHGEGVISLPAMFPKRQL